MYRSARSSSGPRGFLRKASKSIPSRSSAWLRPCHFLRAVSSVVVTRLLRSDGPSRTYGSDEMRTSGLHGESVASSRTKRSDCFRRRVAPHCHSVDVTVEEEHVLEVVLPRSGTRC